MVRLGDHDVDGFDLDVLILVLSSRYSIDRGIARAIGSLIGISEA